ncbi:MAG TPA: DUF4149 domain-containing protein [Terriglobales bacterium]
MSILRFLMFLSLGVWLGGIVLFSVLAPTAFSVLPSHFIAAMIVGPMLSKLHWMGIVAGIIFLLCSIVLTKLADGRTEIVSAKNLLVSLMLISTCISQFSVMPKMAALRKSVGDIEQLSLTDPIRLHFDALHVWSTRLEGGILLLGLIVLYLSAQMRQPQ